MHLEVKIDSSYTEPKVIILTASMTEDVQIILNKLSDYLSQIIAHNTILLVFLCHPLKSFH